MVAYGKPGGFMSGRPPDPNDAFEMAVERALGAAIRESNDVATAMWCAITNQDWGHENGDTASYSFRAAGDLVAAVRRSGDYCDWYMSGPAGTVRDDIKAALDREGWRPIDEVDQVIDL